MLTFWLSNEGITKVVQALWHHNPLSKLVLSWLDFLNFLYRETIWSQFAAKNQFHSFPFHSLIQKAPQQLLAPQIAVVPFAFIHVEKCAPIPIKQCSSASQPKYPSQVIGLEIPHQSGEWGGWELANSSSPQRNLCTIMCMKGETIFNGLSSELLQGLVQSWST